MKHTIKSPRENSQGKSLLSKKGPTSGSGESAAIYHAQLSLYDFGDKIKMSDNDHAVGRTVETLSVAGSDEPISVQEKEARSFRGSSFHDDGQSSRYLWVTQEVR